MTHGTVPLVRVAFAAGCLMLTLVPVVSTQAIVAVKSSTADLSPMSLTLPTISGDLPYFAGKYVRIPTARVRQVISPTLFTVEPATVFRSYMPGQYQALVVLQSPSPGLEKDQVVEIVGRPYTFAGAQDRLGRAWIDALDDDAGKFETRPVIGADIVRTPDGVDVSSARPPEPPR